MQVSSRRLFGCIWLSLVCAVIPAFSETVHDFRTWVNLTAQGKVGGSDWRWYFDLHDRNRNTSSDVDQFVFRPAVGYALNRTSSLWAGYAYTANFLAGGGVLSENRTWQQYLWTGLKGRGTFSSRFRAEQRFFEGADNVGWRVREQVRYLYPLQTNESLAPIVWEELLVHLNSTVRTQRGFDKNRVFTGLGFILNPKTRIELGYMNQFSRSSAGHRMNHILSGVMNLSF